jgi:hypothetical protein
LRAAPTGSRKGMQGFTASLFMQNNNPNGLHALQNIDISKKKKNNWFAEKGKDLE